MLLSAIGLFFAYLISTSAMELTDGGGRDGTTHRPTVSAEEFQAWLQPQIDPNLIALEGLYFHHSSDESLVTAWASMEYPHPSQGAAGDMDISFIRQKAAEAYSPVVKPPENSSSAIHDEGWLPPPENFTVTILTYKRNESLLATLNSLAGLPGLDRVIVLWNAPDFPDKGIKWPNLLPVPIHVSTFNF